MSTKKLSKILLIFAPLALLLFMLGRNILKPGYIIHTDVTEPLQLEKIHERYLYTYSDDWGESYAETARIPLFYLIKTAHDLTGLPDSYFVKTKFIALIIITYSVFTLYTYKWLKFIQKDKENKRKVLIPTIAASLFYLTNFWFTDRLMHFYLFFASCTIPITFYYLYTYLFSKENKPRKLIPLALLLGIFSATPHTVLFQALIGTILTGVFLITQKEYRLKKMLYLGLFALGYLLINSYWLFPVLVTKAAPDKMLSTTIVDFLSQESSLINSIRLMGYWMTPYGSYFLEDARIQPIQYVLAFVPIITTLSVTSYLVVKKKTALALILLFMALGGIFLSSQTVLSKPFYEYLMFESPISFVGWIFRELDKFGIIIAFAYALSFGVFFTLVDKRLKILVAPLFILLITSNLYFYNKTIENQFTPQKVPSEFFHVIDLLKKDPELANAIWYPGNPSPAWSETTSVSYFLTNFSSPKPTITTNSKIINYLDYIGSYENTYQIDAAKALDLIGAKYLILRKDHGIFQKELHQEHALDMQQDLEKVWNGNYLVVYKNLAFSGLIKDHANRIITNQGYEILKDLEDLQIDTSKSYLEYTDKANSQKIESNIKTYYYFPDDQYHDLAINEFKEKFIFPAEKSNHVYTGKTDKWRKSSVENLTHAESSYFLGFYGISLSQFDYEMGVLSADEGVLKEDRNLPPREVYFPTFIQDTRGRFENRNLSFIGDVDLFTYPWTSIISETFALNDVKALQVEAEVVVDKAQEPHLKLFFQDEEHNQQSIKYLFPDYRGKVNDIIKVNDNVSYVKIGLWFRPLPMHQDQILVKNLYIKDRSNNYKNLEFSFAEKTNCYGNCSIYARVLESASGGNMTLVINNTEFEIETLIDQRERPQRYNWLEVGKIYLDQNQEKSEIRVINKKGFNSINALVLVNEDEKRAMEEKIASYKSSANNLKIVPPEDREETEDREKTGSATPIKVNKLNPTKYEISPFLKPTIISLAVPHGESWKITEMPEQKTILINGLLPGWEVKSKENTYTIEFTPQKTFYIGSIISGATFMIGLGAIVYLELKNREVSERISSSHG